MNQHSTVRNRATIINIAAAADVSTATVDRVINGRGGVKSKTRDRVMEVAERLGYLVSSGSETQNVSPVRIEFILPGGTNTFINNLADRIAEIGAIRSQEATITIHRIEGFIAEALADYLAKLRGKTDAIAIIAIDHPLVREVIRDLSNSNIPLLTLVSDISNVPRIGYIGIDNRAAGRLAGHLMSRFIGSGFGKIALFAGSLSYRGHEEREMGFRNILAEEFTNLAIVQTLEVRDDTERSYQEACALLAKDPDIRGIYNIGGGNRGIARALEETERAKNIVFIGHELTEHTRRFLLSGVMDAVIDQNPRVEAREAIDQLIRAARGQPRAPLITIRTHAIFKENIPEF